MNGNIFRSIDEGLYHSSSESPSSENHSEESRSDTPSNSNFDQEQSSRNLPSFIPYHEPYQPALTGNFQRYQHHRINTPRYKVVSSAKSINSVIKKIKKLTTSQINRFDGIKIKFDNTDPNDSNDQNSTNSNSRRQRTDSASASHRNLPRILGTNILSFSKKSENKDQVEDYLRERSYQIEYPPNIRPNLLNYDSFMRWLEDEDMNKEFCKLKTFRDVWGFYLPESPYRRFVDKHFCYVLKRISEHVMRYVFLGYIMKKVVAKSIKLENALHYIDAFPVFHQGLDDPANFLSISRK